MLEIINIDGTKYVNLSDVLDEIEQVHESEKDNGFEKYSDAIAELIQNLRYEFLYG